MKFFDFIKKNKKRLHHDPEQNGFIPRDEKQIEQLAKKRENELQKLVELDEKIIAIQNSTKTTIPRLAPLHHRLRQNYRWYYNWHTKPYANKTHLGILVFYIAAVIFGMVYGTFKPPYEVTKAATVDCTWTNGDADSDWTRPGNWDCGAEAGPPDNNNDVYFDGNVSNDDAIIGDPVSAVASITIKGTNIPNPGDVAYTGTLDVGNNLSTTTAGTGNGNVYLGGGSLELNSTTMTVVGNWTNAGTSFSATTSTVIFSGSTAQTIISGGTGADQDFNNVQISNTNNTVSLSTNDIDIDGTLTIDASANFRTMGQDLTVTTTMTNNGSLTLWGDETVSLPGVAPEIIAGTVAYTGNNDGVQDTYAIKNWAYNNMIIDTTGGATDYFHQPADINVGGNFTITAGDYTTWDGVVTDRNLTVTGNVDLDGTFTIYGDTEPTITVGGNWDNTSGMINPSGTWILTFNGAGAQTITSGGTGDTKDYWDINHSGAGSLQVLSDTLTIYGDFNNSAGSFDSNGEDVYVNGNWTNSAVFTSGANTVYFSSGGAQTIITGGVGADQDFENVHITNTNNTVSLSTNGIDIDGTLTIDASANFRTMGQDLTVTTTMTNNGTLTMYGPDNISTETVTIPGAAPQTIAGTVVYTGAAGADLYTLKYWNYNNLTINSTNGSSQFFMPNNNLAVGGNFALTSGIYLTDDKAMDRNLTVTGNFYIAGTLSVGVDGIPTITVGGNWINISGTIINYSSWILDFNKAAGVQTMYTGGTGTTKVYDDIKHTGAGILTLSTYDLSMTGDLSLTAGTLNMGADITVSGATTLAGVATTLTTNANIFSGTSITAVGINSGIINISTNGTVQLSGNLLFANIGTVNFYDNSNLQAVNMEFGNFVAIGTNITVNIYGNFSNIDVMSGEQNVTFNLDGIGNHTFYVSEGTSLGNVNVGTSSSYAITSNGTISIINLTGGSTNITTATISGDMTANLTSGGTITLTGSNNTLSGSPSFTNLVITGGYSAGGNINVSNNLINSGTLTAGTSTFNFNGNSSQSVTAGTGINKLFYNFTHSGSGTLQTLTDIEIDGNFTNSAGTFNTNSKNIYIAGNFSNSATFTAGSGTVTLDGSGSQGVAGSTTFYNLTISNPSGSSSRNILFAGGSTQTVTGTWTVTGSSGKLIGLNSTDNNQWAINPANASVSYVNVSRSKNIAGASICAAYSESSNNNNTNWQISSGGTCGPPTIENLIQRKTDYTVIPAGGSTNETAVKFTADASSSYILDNLALCVEAKPIGESFINSDDSCGNFIEFPGTPTEVATTINNFNDKTKYHWQARVKDSNNNYSSWAAYNNADENKTDFEINTVPFGALARIALESDNNTPVAGEAFNLNIRLYDSDNNLITDSTDLIKFSSSDKQVVFTNNEHVFSLLDSGTFSQNVTLKIAGDQTITASDSDSNAYNSLTLKVQAAKADANASSLTSDKTKIVPSEETAKITVKITDQFGNGLKNKSVVLSSNRSEDIISPVGENTKDDGTAQFSFSSPIEGESILGANDTTDNLILSSKLTIKVAKPTFAEQLVKKVVTPLATTVAALGFLPLLVQAFPQAFHALASIFPALFTAAGLRRRRKPWGRVYDSLTDHPIDLAAVRLFDAKTHRLTGTKVTDDNGQFNFLLSKGDYYIRVIKAGYKFPPKMSKIKASQLATRLGPGTDLYLGQVFTIQKDGTNINLNIALDPILEKLPTGIRMKMEIKNAFDWLLIGLSYIAIPMLTLGALFSVISLIVTRSKFNFYLVVIYLFILIAFLVTRKIKEARLGQAFDAKTNLPIVGAVVSIFDKEYNAIREVKITDKDGRFAILAPKGEFYLTVDARGYTFPAKIVSKTKKKLYFGETIKNHKPSFINVDVPLDRVVKL